MHCYVYKTMTRRYLFLLIMIVVLFAASLVVGSVDIPMRDVVDILTGGESVRPAWRFIVLESRLPQALTALLSGGALASSGLMLQTAFRNPLAAPDVFGITSGASLMVAVVTLGTSMTALPLFLQHTTALPSACDDRCSCFYRRYGGDIAYLALQQGSEKFLVADYYRYYDRLPCLERHNRT
ncbi:iron compound ABC transporter permease protein [Prevotella sp. CAG:924]|nr:iron compound ABC transporter permease protein [Prevotella sp. CAG:924]